MTTLAQRIENAQNDLNAKRDRLAELTAVDDMDTDAVTELTAQVDAVEKSLVALKAAEQKIGIAAAVGAGALWAVNKYVLPRFQKNPDEEVEEDEYEAEEDEE
jgi:uncharacterized protein YoxC